MLREYPITELDSIDSTNNYAMQLIDANKAQPGMTITAQNQWAGKGQRGKTWVGSPGESLLMSIIVCPEQAVGEQFIFSASVATAIAKVLQKLDKGWQVHIKWPNDIIVNDKKAGGILIENVLRGSQWSYAIIGIGLNVNQSQFPDELPFATSLKIAGGNNFALAGLRDDIREAVIRVALHPPDTAVVMDDYNACLYRRGVKQGFSNADEKWTGKIVKAGADGTLAVEHDGGTIVHYHHGQVTWDWEHQ